MGTETWLDQEPGFRAGLSQARELIGRGLERRAFTAIGSIVVAFVVALALLALRPAYAPRYVLRVVETAQDLGTAPRLKRQLAIYVREAVFTGAALLPLMQRHGLYPALAKNNPPAALESFREDIDVEVYENYFLQERSAGDAPRSARIAVRYRSSNPELALAVTRSLGELIVERERRLRREQALRAARDAELAVARAARELLDCRSSVIETEVAIEQGEAEPRREVELVSLLGSLQMKERQLDQAEKRKTEIDLGLAYEGSGNGLRFELVDDGAIPHSSRYGLGTYVLAGTVALFFAFPFVATIGGALSGKRGDA